MGASRDFLTFSGPPLEVRPPTNLHAKWLRRRGFTQGCTFCSKNRHISYPLISRPPKMSKCCKLLDFEIFRSIWPLTLDVRRENTPYSSSELNESDIVNRQSGGEKLKYLLKFYIGGTHHVISHMRNDDSALCLSTWCLGRNISETVRNRLGSKGPPIGNDPSRVQWSRDRWRHVTPKGQGRDPYMFGAQCPLSRKRLEIETWWQNRPPWWQ